MSSSPGARPTRHGLVFVGALVVAFVAVALLYVTGIGARFVEGLYPPEAVTAQGAHIRDLYHVVFLIAVAIFLLVEGLIIWTIIRYRRTPQDVDLPPQTHGNAIAEIVWTVVPTLIVIFLFIISWQTLNTVDASAAGQKTHIRAVAGQFQWSFDYLSDDGQTILYTEFLPVGEEGGLHVPVGRTIELTLTSNDVIHAFYVPQFLFKRDVVPGRVNRFDFDVDEAQAGQTFRGQCAELCGSGHRIMLFEVHAMTGADFDTWLEAKANPPSPTPAPSGPAPSGEAPSGEPVAPTQLSISAKDLQFSTSELSAPANSPITLTFDNQDTQPHNVKIFKDAIGGEVAFDGEIFTGPASKDYHIDPLAAGTYPFECFVHPTMQGTLTVQ